MRGREKGEEMAERDLLSKEEGYLGGGRGWICEGGTGDEEEWEGKNLWRRTGCVEGRGGKDLRVRGNCMGRRMEKEGGVSGGGMEGKGGGVAMKDGDERIGERKNCVEKKLYSK
ncbi:hypothetical protein ACH5RR_006283 [Cinchona calisaya]|uniref:Uncharacterized protein n=1 Tax=Cinchona calisaya TaxID=153742 RepID=A0ABD3ANJ3_9GENT